MSNNVFDKFESSLERIVEGSVRKVFRNSVQPAEISRKLDRAMVANQWISVQGRLVPNQYVVQLHPVDYAVFAESVPSLNLQLAEWLETSATKRGYATIGAIEVSIVEKENVPQGAIDIVAHHVGSELIEPAKPALHPTTEFAPSRAESLRPDLSLRIPTASGTFVDNPIRKTLTMVGRALENDIVIDFSEISRFHARFELGVGSLTVTDLGSTNGTWVNSYPATTSTLVHDGDLISFGTVNCQLIHASRQAVARNDGW